MSEQRAGDEHMGPREAEDDPARQGGQGGRGGQTPPGESDQPGRDRQSDDSDLDASQQERAPQPGLTPSTD